MKPAFYLLAASVAASAMEIPASSVSSNQTFAVRNGNQFANSSLDDYEGKILVVMMMTPWCPGCISNGAAVGNGILDHFNAASRGVLRGKNDQGIEIDSLMLSVEPGSNWDSTCASLASSNGYEKWGLDANALRQNPRVMLGYYRGGYPNGVNSSNLYNWGEDRRRVVVLNLVRDSPSHEYREILINRNNFTDPADDPSDSQMAQALINAIEPAPATTSFAQWSAGHPFSAGTSGPGDDPDRDGSVNLLEFFHGTHPLQAASRDSGPALRQDPSGLSFVYRRARNIGGVSAELQTSTGLGAWQAVAPVPPQTAVDVGDLDEITVDLPAAGGPTRFYRLSVTLGP